jgi:hypothetical protein
MQNTLRSLVLASAVLAITATAATTAKAATAINVPFEFSIGNQICPAGHYLVERDTNGASVKLVGASQSFTWGVHPGDGAPTDSRVVLKFDDIGSAHQLSTIQYGALTTSKLDRKLFSETHTQIELGK